jgi:ABC-2 type transport system permease protein
LSEHAGPGLPASPEPSGGPRRKARKGPASAATSDPSEHAGPGLPASPTARGTSPLLAILRYTLRVCVPRRREVLILPLAGAVLFGLLSRISNESAADAFARVGGSAMHTLILPITCLVVGDALLGAEVRSGVFAFTWLSPVPYRTIVLGRWLGGCLIAAAILGPAAAAGAVVAGAPGSIVPAVIAAIAGAAAYLALFIAVGATFQRPVVWSLALVLLVERLLGAGLAGIAQLSPGWLAQEVLVGLTHAASDLQRKGIPHGWAAVGRLAVVAAVGLAIATRRLRRLRPASAAD